MSDDNLFTATDTNGNRIAHAVLELSERDRWVWHVLWCPICGARHEHDGGARDDDPHASLDYVYGLCDLDRDLEDDEQGYRLARLPVPPPEPTELPFNTWMHTQIERGGIYTDIIDAAWIDRAWPRDGATIGELEAHLSSRLYGAGEGLAVLRQLWWEWQRNVLAPGERDARRVYFVQAATGGAIKIGYAADVAARVAALQIGNAADLVVLATLPGGPKLERALHAQFATWRARGEWFYPNAELETFIARARAGDPRR